MAYRRSLTTSSNLLARRFNPSFCYVIHEDDRKRLSSSSDGSSQHGTENFLQRLFSNSSGFGAFSCEGSWHSLSLPSRTGIDIRRHMSSSSGGNLEPLTDISGAFPDTTLETVVQQAPVVNEVVSAAADSFLPVAALQMLVDGVHSFTGCNWWASIAITTLLIRGAITPFLINRLKATTQISLMQPHLDEIRHEMQNNAKTDPDAVTKGRRKMTLLFKEYGVTPFSPYTGVLIQGPVLACFFFAILNMAEKVPTFKYGGAYWFTDLSTPDSWFIFPCLAALSVLIMVECILRKGLEGNPIGGILKKYYRLFAFLTIPFTVALPKAIFCYLIASNMFSLVYGLVIMRPEVRKFLGVPIIPPALPSTTPETHFSLASLHKQYKDALAKEASKYKVLYDVFEDSDTDSPADSGADSPADSAADPPADLRVDSPKVSNREIS